MRNNVTDSQSKETAINEIRANALHWQNLNKLFFEVLNLVLTINSLGFKSF